MPAEQFRLPDLGEGLPDAEIVRWLVDVGERVAVNQPIVEVETVKARVELLSPFAGVLTVRHAEPGETVVVGRPLMTIDTGEPGPAPAGNLDLDGHPEERPPMLVGYGPRGGPGTPGAGPAAAAAPPAGDGPAGGARHAPPGRRSRPVVVRAKPPVRKLARDRGVDLRTVVGTGPHGTISRADVEAARASGGPGEVGARVRRIAVTGVRRSTASAMVASAAGAPQVTEFLSVDVTETMAARDRIAALPEFAGIKVTPLLLVAKALLAAVRRRPMINSRWEEGSGDSPAQIVVHEYVNLGIAVASPRGLLVPNIPDADRLDLVTLARSLHELTMTARAGKTAPAALRNGTITITNIGVFGVDSGTPILNPPEAAILALGSIRPMPWVRGGELAVRTVAQLALTFDHRIVDGELGSQVLADVGRMLTDPTLILAWA
ncbi:dihydrolipoamide acetyltransferase family protein [Candidatus Protofrankia californiensis]|uniref:dihydrolipoamide acetyltransferase family protein n=1 Tax=Candidatus Protofrankia californiensis TaxID=1839754 RepID=UPI001040EA70|nr:dihydrolipoamide acetyltransferase family protein [Candidatus Protofrankia californiensis]